MMYLYVAGRFCSSSLSIILRILPGHIWIAVQWSFDPSFRSLESIFFTMLDREEEVETKDRIVEAALSDSVPAHSEVCYCVLTNEEFPVIPYNTFLLNGFFL